MGRVMRFWLARVLLFAVVGTGLVLILHIPGGLYLGPTERSTVDGVEHLSSPQFWSTDLYWNEVRQFGRQVREGNLPYYRSHRTNALKENFMPVLKDTANSSMKLFGYAALIGSMAGVLMGVTYAVRSRAPRVLGFVISTIGLSLPDFMVVILGQALTIWTYRRFNTQLWNVLADPNTLKGMALPIIALAVLPMGYLARVTGAALDEIMWEDYIRTARAKGLPEWRVIFGHALRNALPRVVAGLPGLMVLTLSSLVVVEQLTTWPGLAKLLFAGVFRNQDAFAHAGEWYEITPQIMALATVLFLGCFLLLEGAAQTLRLIYAKPTGEVNK